MKFSAKFNFIGSIYSCLLFLSFFLYLFFMQHDYFVSIACAISIIISAFNSIRLRKKISTDDIKAKEGLYLFLTSLFIFTFLAYYMFIVPILVVFFYWNPDIVDYYILIISSIFMFIGIYYFFKKRVKIQT